MHTINRVELKRNSKKLEKNSKKLKKSLNFYKIVKKLRINARKRTKTHGCVKKQLITKQQEREVSNV